MSGIFLPINKNIERKTIHQENLSIYIVFKINIQNLDFCNTCILINLFHNKEVLVSTCPCVFCLIMIQQRDGEGGRTGRDGAFVKFVPESKGGVGWRWRCFSVRHLVVFRDTQNIQQLSNILKGPYVHLFTYYVHLPQSLSVDSVYQLLFSEEYPMNTEGSHPCSCFDLFPV